MLSDLDLDALHALLTIVEGTNKIYGSTGLLDIISELDDLHRRIEKISPSSIKQLREKILKAIQYITE